MSYGGTASPEAAQAQQPQSSVTLEQKKRMLDDFRTLTEQARKASNTYRDYYDSDQLTDRERQTLRSRRQPEIIINRVKRAINGIMGVVEQGKTDPRAYLRNPPDKLGGGSQPAQQAAGVPMPGQQIMGGNGPPPDAPDAGDIASMTLRFIADTNHFGPLKMDVLENFLIEGTGAAITEWVGDEITVTQIRWEEFVYDPRSRRADFKDARYLGVAKWMYADQLALTYPEKKNDIDSACSDGGFFGWGRDRPNDQLAWVDKKQKRLLVAELYYLDSGQWWRCVFITNTTLEEGLSAYVDDKKQPVCPIEAVSCYVDRENRRYGEVKDMVGPQDGLNMSHSKRLHAANVRQVQPIDANSFPQNADEVRKEAARPDGVIPAGWKIADNNFSVATAVEGIQEYKGELERMGPNPAILGRQGADASGRAVLARQQAGMTEMARPLGRYSDWELRMYHQFWWRARQFYTAPKWIRVTDDIGAPQYIQVNKPTPPQMMVDPQTGQPIQVPGKPDNHIAQMDVDIIVDTVPDTATLLSEQFQEISELAKMYGPQQVPFKLILQLSSLPRKREILGALDKAQAEAQQAQAPAQQIMMAEKQADIAETQSSAARNQAQANLYEVQTVTAALQGHVQATAAAQLPPGYTLGPNGQHVPLQQPPEPTQAPGAP